MIKIIFVLATTIFISSCATGPECCCAIYSVNGNFLIGETMGAKSCAAFEKHQGYGRCVDEGVCEVKVDEGIFTN